MKPLLPKIGRKHGAAIPAIMAAARENAVEYHAGRLGHAGRRRRSRRTRSRSSRRPRPGTAVAHDEGLVVVIDTELTDELRAEGDARELQRAIQDLRKDAGLALDDRIELWVDGLADDVAAHLAVRRRGDARRRRPSLGARRPATAASTPDPWT